MEDRYTPEEIHQLTFIKMERVGRWYDFYTEKGEKYSTQYEDRAKEVVLHSNEEYRIAFDTKSQQHRIMGKLPSMKN